MDILTDVSPHCALLLIGLLARRATMRNVVESTSTTLTIDEIEPNADLRDSAFTVRKLKQRSH